MRGQLLLSIRHASRVRTLVFDTPAQPEICIGPEGESDPRHSWVRLGVLGDDLLLQPMGPGGVIMPGVSEPISDPVVIDWQVPAIFGLTAVGSDARRESYARASVHVRPQTAGMRTFSRHVCVGRASLIVGRDATCDVTYASPFVSQRHARLSWADDAFSIEDLRSGNGTYVNGAAVPALQPKELRPGDVVQVLDLTLVVGKGFLCVNRPEGLVSTPWEGDATNEVPRVCVPDKDVPPERFYPAPRLTQAIHATEVSVEAPPAKRDADDQSVLMQVGPSFFMGMCAVVMAASAISRVSGGADMASALPMVAMAVAMVGGSVLWPIVSSVHERRVQAAFERRRTNRYVSYLDDIARTLVSEAGQQAEVLRETRPSAGELLRRAEERSPLLMSRTSAHEDFMELRVGTGDCPSFTEVMWPKQRMLPGRDVLWDKVASLEGRRPSLHDVPLACSFVSHPVVGVLGSHEASWEFARGIVVQVATLHSHLEAKVALVAHERDRAEWDFMARLAHHVDDESGRRLVALGDAGMARLDRLLERELDRRLSVSSADGRPVLPHIVVICAHMRLYGRSSVLGRLAALHEGLGFTLVVLGDRVSDLPRECGYIIDLESRVDLGIGADDTASIREARMFERSDVRGTLVRFDPDTMVSRWQARAFARAMAPVRLEVGEELLKTRTQVGFLELFEAGMVEHLDLGRRWARRTASMTLEVPVGIDRRGAAITLDLHESAHGPHGLIAGTTGSGKSEFIISFVLSLCVCHAPDEVAFVLIDYKGGGLVDAFDNGRLRLPHLAGTITNLDGEEIGRCLRSVRSELRRRQRVLRHARDVTGEATMDIDRYLALFKQGVVSDPLPHLVVVADEFAELKQQEPEFMEELMSAARIGRSLGVHLVLATQKPTGVVNDQIWSNARFKVSLKVSERADSREMVRRDDAARFTRPGEFCLLVGYDEYYTHGQASYAGCAYDPKDRFEPRRDESVMALDAEGEAIACVQPVRGHGQGDTSELDAVLDLVVGYAARMGASARQLWLDPLPAHVLLRDLERMLEETRIEGASCAVGLLDDPEFQQQYPFVLKLDEEGNVMLYGAQGSGTERVLRSMLVSLCPRAGCDGAWVYGVDFGAGLLEAIREMPHVGGVVRLLDEEQVDRLLRMLERELVRRRDADDVTATHVVLAVANLSALLELRQDFLDRLVAMTRDGTHFRVHVFATVERAHAVPLRLQANFETNVPMRLGDESEYRTLLGDLDGCVPPKRPCRGLVRVERRVLVLQGAMLAEDQESELVEIRRRSVAARVHAFAPPPPVPWLPAHVTPKAMGAPLEGDCLPVGFYKKDAQPCAIDVGRGSHLLVLGNDPVSLGAYLKGAYECLRGGGCLFVDTREMLGRGIDDDSVVSSVEWAAQAVRRIAHGEEVARMVVFCGIVDILDALGEEDAALLLSCVAGEARRRCPPFVFVAEHWQVAACYDEWFRMVSGQGTGIWVGSGFADQSVFPLSRVLQAYRAPATVTDGFVVAHGDVRPVRLVEPEGGSDT